MSDERLQRAESTSLAAAMEGRLKERFPFILRDLPVGTIAEAMAEVAREQADAEVEQLRRSKDAAWSWEKAAHESNRRLRRERNHLLDVIHLRHAGPAQGCSACIALLDAAKGDHDV